MDRALLARVEKQAWFHRYPRGLPIGLLILSLLIAIVAAMAIEQADSEARRSRLDAAADELSSALQRRASENIAYLVAGSSMFSARTDVAPEDFQIYAESIAPGMRERGGIATGWGKWLPRSEVADFVGKQRATVAQDFVIHPAPSAAAGHLLPVTMTNPLTSPNRSALGYDMYSEPVRRMAIDAARASRYPTATGRVQLVRDAGRPEIAAFLIFVPVFDRRAPGQPLLGFVFSGFRAQEFLESARNLVNDPNFDARLYDTMQDPDHLMASTSGATSQGFTLKKSVSIAGRTWVLAVSDKRSDWISVLAQIVLLFGLIVGSILMALGLLVTRRAAEDRKVLEWLTGQAQIRTSLARELNHRVKNTLANVLSIVSLTRRRATTVDEFADGLAGRLRALSATHDLLLQREWRDAPVGEIVRSELAPYMQDDDHHVTLDGPDVEVAPNDALSLGLALHELVTNAAKYGALSELGGNVAIRWSVAPGRNVAVDWRETGGPLVTEPDRRGFGMDLIERIVANELRQEVKVEFKPGGVECRILIPLRDRTAFAIRSEARGGAG
jgi:two-component sensor histidine kinase